MEWSGFRYHFSNWKQWIQFRKKMNAHNLLPRVCEIWNKNHCLNETRISHQNHFNEEGVGQLFVNNVKTHLQTSYVDIMPKKENHIEWCFKKINSTWTKKSCLLSLAVSNNMWIDSNVRNGKITSCTQVNNRSTKSNKNDHCPHKAHLHRAKQETLITSKGGVPHTYHQEEQ